MKKIEVLVDEGKTVPTIARELGIPYNSALLIIKKSFTKIYETRLKRKFHKLNEAQKKMTPELAYILGVMFGDGSVYGKDKVIRLGTIDIDFRDYFATVLEAWSKKKPYTTYYLNRGRIHYHCILWSKDAGIFLDSIRKRGCLPRDILECDNDLVKMLR